MVSSHDKIYLKVFNLNTIKHIFLSIVFFLYICLHFPIIYVKFITWTVFEGAKMSITFYKGEDKLYKCAFTENISKDKSIATDQGKENKFHFHYG